MLSVRCTLLVRMFMYLMMLLHLITVGSVLANQNVHQDTIVIKLPPYKYNVTVNEVEGIYTIHNHLEHSLTCTMCTGNTYLGGICTSNNSTSPCFPCPDNLRQKEDTGLHYNTICDPKPKRWTLECGECPAGFDKKGCISEDGLIKIICCQFDNAQNKNKCDRLLNWNTVIPDKETTNVENLTSVIDNITAVAFTKAPEDKMVEGVNTTQTPPENKGTSGSSFLEKFIEILFVIAGTILFCFILFVIVMCCIKRGLCGEEGRRDGERESFWNLEHNETYQRIL